ncbi:MAG: hypothetical protein ACTSRS_12425 [Candidatus Helarchaeota archaeon]
MERTMEKLLLDPRIRRDRIQALLRGFTAPTGSCPYYRKQLPSTCALDPSSRRVWRCEGVCFFDGFCCNRITNRTQRWMI